MRAVCIECGEPIRKGEGYEKLPGKAVIHEDCMESILDKPARTESNNTTQTSETVSRDWMW
jgi:hypothetical protein